MGNLWNPVGGIYREAAPFLDWVTWGSDIFSGDLISGAFIAALGAGIGAWMAGRIARDAKVRDEHLTELRSINYSITLCESILDLTAGLNRQFIQPLLETYAKNVELLEAARKSNSTRLDINISHLKGTPLDLPVSEIRDIIKEKITLSPNGIRSIVALSESVKQLNVFIGLHAALVDRFVNKDFPEGLNAHQFYFSLQVDGQTNSEYQTCLTGLGLYVKDILFFSSKLSGTLTQRGLIVRERYLKISGEKILIRRINDAPDEDGYQIPPDSEYWPWMRGWENEADTKPTIRRRWKFW